MIISVIELNYHFDSLDNLCQLFDRDENEVYVFTTQELFSRIGALRQNSSCTVFLQKGTRVRFIKEHLKLINSSDVIFVNTISRDFRLFSKIKFVPPIIARIHNLHKTFQPAAHFAIPKSPLRIWKTFSFLMREGVVGGYFYFRRSAIGNIDYFSFPDLSLKDYAVQKAFVFPNKIGPILPIKFHDPQYVSSAEIIDGRFRIVIIGSIDFKRRDYFTVLRALKKLGPTNDIKIVVTFLGDSGTRNGKELKKMVSQNGFLPNIEFVFYSGYVALSDFREVVSRADLLLSPIRRATVVDIFHEYYGLSKTSGTISDMIMYGKPMVVCDLAGGLGDLSRFVSSYSSDMELVDIVSGFVQNYSLLQEMQVKLQQYLASEYNKDKIYDNFIEFVNRIPKRV